MNENQVDNGSIGVERVAEWVRISIDDESEESGIAIYLRPEDAYTFAREITIEAMKAENQV